MDQPDVIRDYFAADAQKDTDAVVALFAEDAVVVDEERTWRGPGEIRAWRDGVASRFEYSTEVLTVADEGDHRFLVSGRIEGDFPGGTADLTWRFTVTGNRIKALEIAP
ncbi:nuclear transport factor 2 family protein [Lentzea sp.]|uniref:nuclear transport factor 2 family protein n=1 Tax=Lentzea sp. TaxID=56099 RepID=UPI002C943C59|nr:nuclear transport factor 2 family protein [Lentzea sp.]HUQ58843.1 nuclear transport factor 2 family protein [Lentzea sp.]